MPAIHSYYLLILINILARQASLSPFYRGQNRSCGCLGRQSGGSREDGTHRAHSKPTPCTGAEGQWRTGTQFSFHVCLPYSNRPLAGRLGSTLYLQAASPGPGHRPMALVKQVKALPGPGCRGTHRDLRMAFGLLNRAGHRVPTEPHSVTFLSFSFLLKNRSRKYTHFNPPTRADFVEATVPWGVGRGVGRARPVLIKVLAMSLSREMAGRDGR